MTARRPCLPAPGPLEDYTQQFDPLLASVAQRRGLRDYLQGLLLPRDRNKTLTALADAEPITGAQHRQVQRLQWFLSESTWDHEAVNQRRIALLQADPVTAPHAQGVLVIDDTGDRKDGNATAHVARQYLGSVGKTDNGIVAVTSLWADPRCYWPLHAVPYTPASRLAKGKSDPGFRTKPQLAVELVEAARQAKIPFRAVVADCFYGDNTGFVEALGRQACGSCWPSSPARAPGHPMMRRTPQWRPLASWAGAARGGRTHGGGSPAGSARGTPRPGGPPTRCLAVGAGPAASAGGGHHRPRHPAEAFHLVPAHQPGSPRLTPRPAGPACRDRRTVWAAQLGGAGLQAGQGRAGLGRLPSQKRPGHPPPLDPGVLGVQLLLARRPGGLAACRGTRTARSHDRVGSGRRPDARAGGSGTSRSPPPAPRRRASGCRGRRRCGGCGPGWPRGCGCSAAGVDGQPARRPWGCSRRLTGSAADDRSTPTYHRNQQTTVTRSWVLG